MIYNQISSSDVSNWNNNHQKRNFLKNRNKLLYLSTGPLNSNYCRSKQLNYNKSNMDGDLGTADVEPDDAESTQVSVSQCIPTNCNYDNDRFKLECAKCKRIVHDGCTSLPTYQLQLFLIKGYWEFTCCKCVKIPSYLHAISFNLNEAHLKTAIKKLEGELREQEERFTAVGNPDYYVFTNLKVIRRNKWKYLEKTSWKTCLFSCKTVREKWRRN